MKNTWLLIPILIGVLLVLGFTSPQSAVLAQAVTSSPTPTTTVTPANTATSTTTPTPTYIPTPTPTQIPISADTGLPVVINLVESGLPDDGYGPDRYPVYINPLTGLVVSDPQIFERRPVAIKVTNHPRYVRPQSGLSKADLVYEYYMEQGIARFIAVFYGQDAEKVGPVRSGRLFDEHIFRMYSTYFTFGYADTRVKAYFDSLETEIVDSFVLENDLDHARKCGVSAPSRLCRDPELEGYNTMFANTEEIQAYFDRAYGDNDRPDLSGMYFSDHVMPSIDPAAIVKIRFSPSMYNYWEYDSVSDHYLRWQEMEGNADETFERYAPHFDVLTGEQLSAANVVVLYINHKYFAYTEGSEIMGMDFNGRGQAWVFRDGFAYPAEWVRPGDGGVLRLYTPDGEPFPLKPGRTWFEVVSQYTDFQRDGQTWYFHFQTPPVPYGRVYLIDPGVSPLEWFYEFQNPGKIMPWNGVIDTPTPTPQATDAN